MARSALRRPVRRMPAEKRISDIMVAARAVFTEHGANDALISEIAERAGVVEGSIYRFFSNKRELVERVVERWYEDTLADFGAQFDGVRGAWNQLRVIVHHHLMTIKREPALARIVFQDLRPAPDYRATRVFQLNQAYTGRIVEVVRAGVLSGEFRPDVSPPLVRDMVFGCIEHRTWAFLRNEGDFDPASTADAIANLVYRAIAVAPERSDRTAVALDRLERAAERLERLADVPAPERRKRERQTLK
jgi:TetR/AcrR family fatty acid metabolism transcriptional regulator